MRRNCQPPATSAWARPAREKNERRRRLRLRAWSLRVSRFALESADVDRRPDLARIADAALVEQQARLRTAAGMDGGTAGQQGMRARRAAVVVQRGQQWIDAVERSGRQHDIGIGAADERMRAVDDRIGNSIIVVAVQIDAAVIAGDDGAAD